MNSLHSAPNRAAPREIMGPIELHLYLAASIADFTFSTVKKVYTISVNSFTQFRTICCGKRKKKRLKKRVLTQKQKKQLNIISGLSKQVLPKLLSGGIGTIPSMYALRLKYKAGVVGRYTDYKAVRLFDYKNRAKSVKIVRVANSIFIAFRSSFSHFVINQMASKIHLKHLLRDVKENRFLSAIKLPRLVDLAIESLALSCKHNAEVDQYVASLSLSSPEESFIARLHWYKMKGILPLGMPDPDNVSLNSANLQIELNRAMQGQLEQLSALIVDKVIPEDLKYGPIGLLYAFEGRDQLVQGLASVLGTFVIEQYSEPHLLTLAILYGFGIEISEFELDGFGQGETEKLLKTGMELLTLLVTKEGGYRISEHFKSSGLRAARGSMEALKQKKRAKHRLKEVLSELIHNAIKGESQGSYYKSVRKSLEQMPFMKIPVATMHCMAASLGYILAFPLREERDVSFGGWLMQNLSGYTLSDFLAENLVELLHHPMWRITFMQVLENLHRYLLEIDTGSVVVNQADEYDYLAPQISKVSEFLFHHMFESVEALADKSSIKNHVAGLATAGFVYLLNSNLSVSFRKVGGGIMDLVMPSIEEITLYIRVSELFRRHGITIQCNDKFWEVFIREYLNSCVEKALLHGSSTGTVSFVLNREAIELRERCVSHLLRLDDEALSRYLSQVPLLPDYVSVADSHHWELLKGGDAFDAAHPVTGLHEPTVSILSPKGESKSPTLRKRSGATLNAQVIEKHFY